MAWTALSRSQGLRDTRRISRQVAEESGAHMNLSRQEAVSWHSLERASSSALAHQRNHLHTFPTSGPFSTPHSLSLSILHHRHYHNLAVWGRAQACIQILPKDPTTFNVDNVRCVKIPGNSPGPAPSTRSLSCPLALLSLGRCGLPAFSPPLLIARDGHRRTPFAT